MFGLDTPVRRRPRKQNSIKASMSWFPIQPLRQSADEIVSTSSSKPGEGRNATAINGGRRGAADRAARLAASAALLVLLAGVMMYFHLGSYSYLAFAFAGSFLIHARSGASRESCLLARRAQEWRMGRSTSLSARRSNGSIPSASSGSRQISYVAYEMLLLAMAFAFSMERGG